tara:strand:+ start:1138 stop:1323 length:186 start_codon:yes stop_codon:yes gene_type:complete
MNKQRIKELESLKKEAEQKIVYFKDFIQGKPLCERLKFGVKIEGEEQVIVNINVLIKKLSV